MPPISSTLSPAHAATLKALAELSTLDAIGRLHAMPKALSVALCASCGVSREDHTWASQIHACAQSLDGPKTIRSPMSGLASFCA